MHTSPFFLLSLAEYVSIHNHGASVVVVFVAYTYYLGGIQGWMPLIVAIALGCNFARKSNGRFRQEDCRDICQGNCRD
jgi:hypothetical protein